MRKESAVAVGQDLPRPPGARLVGKPQPVALAQHVDGPRAGVVADLDEDPRVDRVAPVDAAAHPLEAVALLVGHVPTLEVEEHPALAAHGLAQVLVGMGVRVDLPEGLGVGMEGLAEELARHVKVGRPAHEGAPGLLGVARVGMRPVRVVARRVEHAERPESGRPAAPDRLLHLAHLRHAAELVELLPHGEADVHARVVELQGLGLLGVVQPAEQDHLAGRDARDAHGGDGQLELVLDAEAADGARQGREGRVAQRVGHLAERHAAQMGVGEHEHDRGQPPEHRGLERAAPALADVLVVAVGHDVAPDV